MNFGEKESFFEKHPYFFKNYSFKFVGLRLEVQKGFENIILRLSGTISEDADYAFTDYKNFKNIKNESTELYNINYIRDSLEKNCHLDLNLYKFVPLDVNKLQSNNACCLNAQYILRTNSCIRYFYDNICCSNCAKIQMKDSNFDNKENNDNQNTLNISRIVKSPNIQQRENKIPNINEKDQLNSTYCQNSNIESDRVSDENSNIESDRVSNENSKKSLVVRKRRIVSSDNSDSCDSESKINRIVRKHKKVKMKQTKQETINQSDTSSDSSSSQLKKNISKNRSKNLIYLSDSDDITIISDDKSKNDSRKTISSENIIKNDVFKKTGCNTINISGYSQNWWDSLPPPNPNPDFVENKRMHGDRRRGHTFSVTEKKIMLTYLIKNNLYHKGVSRNPWYQMHKDGYLRHRSVEALNNNFRKVILPKIKEFNLPKNIVKKFIREECI